MAAREVVWLRKLLVGLFGQRLEPTVIHCDNQSCMKLSVNPVSNDRTKHVEIQYHYVRDVGQRHVVELWYIPTDEHVADVLTKSLCRGKFEYFRGMLGVVENVSLTNKEY